jgi:hypothetical protein
MPLPDPKPYTQIVVIQPQDVSNLKMNTSLMEVVPYIILQGEENPILYYKERRLHSCYYRKNEGGEKGVTAPARY